MWHAGQVRRSCALDVDQAGSWERGTLLRGEKRALQNERGGPGGHGCPRLGTQMAGGDPKWIRTPGGRAARWAALLSATASGDALVPAPH